jgi:hypothetical protein
MTEAELRYQGHDNWTEHIALERNRGHFDREDLLYLLHQRPAFLVVLLLPRFNDQVGRAAIDRRADEAVAAARQQLCAQVKVDVWLTGLPKSICCNQRAQDALPHMAKLSANGPPIVLSGIPAYPEISASHSGCDSL